MNRSERLSSIADSDVDRIIKMALEDRTPFELIKLQFGLFPDDVPLFMRKHLSKKSFLRWRQRAHERGHLKHPLKNGIFSERFKSKNQRIDGSVKQR
jgi:uncharacterized protein (TIGR03643 family)